MSEDSSHSTGGTDVIVKKKMHVKEPPLYLVILLNDDYTPMEFVVEVLEKYFDKSHGKATEIMLRVHHEGKAVCGTYPHEIAETKVAAVIALARQNGYPLECSIDKQ